MEEKDFPPNMKLFAGSLRKNEMTQLKINQFKDWMKGKKFNPEWQDDATALLEKAEASLKSAPPPARTFNAPQAKGGFGHGGRPGDRGGRNVQAVGSNANAADPSIIGFPFHNPYTFIPFPSKKPERHDPTPLSIDEIEKDRVSGVIQVKIRTLSPLLTSQAFAKKDKQQHHPILKVGNDVIVPASSVRGSLRNLMSIICGGTLSYVDEDLWLCQGRDTPLGGFLKGKQDNLYLAIVEKPGDSFHDGRVTWGPASLVKDSALQYVLQKIGFHKEPSQYNEPLWIDNPENPMRTSKVETPECPWRVKISGRKVNGKGTPHEGAFRPSRGATMILPASLWADYQGRNRNGVRPELRKGDLIWLQSQNVDKTITGAGDVKSIQWARWGRTGNKLVKVIPPGFLPDAINTDGKVDMVSDMFGTVFLNEKEIGAGKITSFAARVVPENLVFKDAAGSVFKNNMPPLSSPHPGCVAFYLNNDNYDLLSINDPPRGYKVYRTSTKNEQDADAPWHYEAQPIYNRATPKRFDDPSNKMLFSADLLPADKTGTLKISFRALNEKELSLLVLALTCDFRFGGGKPLGLGHCIAEQITIVKEDGTRLEFTPEKTATLPDGYSIDEAILNRAVFYCKTQIPVDNMRYPRFTKENGDRGGMIWFSKFAMVKRNPNGPGTGLQTVWIGGKLREETGKEQMRAQALPKFKAEDPASDCLFGYDAQFLTQGPARDNRTIVIDVVAPDQSRINPNAPRFDNVSQNSNTRQDNRNKRSSQ